MLLLLLVLLLAIHSVDKLTTQSKHGLMYSVFFLFELTKAGGIMALCRCCFW